MIKSVHQYDLDRENLTLDFSLDGDPEESHRLLIVDIYTIAGWAKEQDIYKSYLKSTSVNIGSEMIREKIFDVYSWFADHNNNGIFMIFLKDYLNVKNTPPLKLA